MNEAVNDRNQLSITLSDRAYEDYTKVAEFLGIPRARLIADVIHEYHRSPSFSSLLRRSETPISDELRQKLVSALEQGNVEEAIALLNDQ